MNKPESNYTRRGTLVLIAAGLVTALAACADGNRPPPREFYRRGRDSRGGGERGRN